MAGWYVWVSRLCGCVWSYEHVVSPWLRRPRLYPRLWRCIVLVLIHYDAVWMSRWRNIYVVFSGQGGMENRFLWGVTCSSEGLVPRIISMIDIIVEGSLDVEKGDRFEWAVWYKFNSWTKRVWVRDGLIRSDTREDKGDREGIPHTHPIP